MGSLECMDVSMPDSRDVTLDISVLAKKVGNLYWYKAPIELPK